MKKQIYFLLAITLLSGGLFEVTYAEVSTRFPEARYQAYRAELNDLVNQLTVWKDRLVEKEKSEKTTTNTSAQNSGSSAAASDPTSSTGSVVAGQAVNTPSLDRINSLITSLSAEGDNIEKNIANYAENKAAYDKALSESKDFNETVAEEGEDAESDLQDQAGESLASQGITPEDVANNTPAYRRAMENFREDHLAGASTDSGNYSGGSGTPASPEAGYQEGANVGELIPWSRVSTTLLPRGVGEADITDICSGLKFRIRRTGGSNHADSETITAADTGEFQKMKNIPSWLGRPVIATMRSGQKVAAAIRPFPHAYDRISGNNMKGHFDIYFKGSVGHASPNSSRYPNPMMQKNVELAAKGRCN